MKLYIAGKITSKGARMEFDRAIDKGKTIMFQQTA